MVSAHGKGLYRRIWRWHFYAGLFVLPFILILSVTGAIYLFKPQIDRWEEAGFRGLPVSGAVSASSAAQRWRSIPAAGSTITGCRRTAATRR